MVDQTKQSGRIFTVKPIQESSKYIKILVYADFGAGKTELGGTAADVPSMADVLILDCEGGTRTIMDSPRVKNKDAIDIVPINEFMAAANVVEYLKRHVIARDADNIEALRKLQSSVTGVPEADITKPRKYRTVVIDSLTELDLLSMYNLLGIKIDNAIKADQDVATFAEYKKNNQLINLVIRALRDLPINLILVCSASYTQDEKKRMNWTPAMTGQLRQQVQGIVDIVGFLQVGSPNEKGVAPRRLSIQPVGNFNAKNRLAGYSSPHIDNPSMAAIYAIMESSETDKS